MQKIRQWYMKTMVYGGINQREYLYVENRVKDKNIEILTMMTMLLIIIFGGFLPEVSFLR